MTQYARPSSDITTGWTTTPLWSKIDEVTASDADFITGTGATKTAECKLSAVTDPVSSVNHTWRTRLRATGSSAGEKVTLSLYQGATLIATLINAGTVARGSFADWSGTLTAAQADAITDYSDLRFRWVTGGSNGASETIDCSWAVLEVPDATSIYDESVSLSNSRSDSEDTFANIADGVSLGRIADMVDGTLGTFDSSVEAIQKSLGIEHLTQSDIQAAIILSILKLDSYESSTTTTQTYEEAVSLSKTLSQLVDNASFVSALMSLARTLGLSENTASVFSASLLISLSKIISQNVAASVEAGAFQAKTLNYSASVSDIVAAAISLARASSISLDSEKVFVSSLSLSKVLSYSGNVHLDSNPNLATSLTFSIGIAGLLNCLTSIDLSRVSNVVLLAGQDLSVSMILSKIAQLSTDGTLGIAIIQGSVIIMDTELMKVIISDLQHNSVQISDEEL